ncbi:MAG: carbon storage regulator CsrA [Actinomycetota bacterium]|nr:carbon storage regulator CsrA [Actinomycetota bacterium]
MLVLTRKANQAIVIGEDVEVSVLAVVGDKVRIGIDAPRSIPVYRKEIWLEIKREGPRRSEPETDRAAVDEALERLKGGE